MPSPHTHTHSITLSLAMKLNDLAKSSWIWHTYHLPPLFSSAWPLSVS